MAAQTRIRLATAIVLALAASGCSKAKSSADAAQAQRYLAGGAIPDSAAILPPPPAANSEALARDVALRSTALGLRGTPRYALAVADADRSETSTVNAFQCAFGTAISPKVAPALSRLLAKVRLDVRASAYKAKGYYNRPRPWVAAHGQVCRSSEALVRSDGSYPSARGAVGWAYALVLSEVNPSRRDALLRRGREFGESRVVCDAEWQSDVEAGYILATAAVSRMQQSQLFLTDLAAARKELSEMLRSGQRAPLDCALEDRARGGDRGFAAQVAASSQDKKAPAAGEP